MTTLNPAPATAGPHAGIASVAKIFRTATFAAGSPWTAALVPAAIGAGAAVGTALALASTLTLNVPLG